MGRWEREARRLMVTQWNLTQNYHSIHSSVISTPCAKCQTAAEWVRTPLQHTATPRAQLNKQTRHSSQQTVSTELELVSHRCGQEQTTLRLFLTSFCMCLVLYLGIFSIRSLFYIFKSLYKITLLRKPVGKRYKKHWTHGWLYCCHEKWHNEIK